MSIDSAGNLVMSLNCRYMTPHPHGISRVSEVGLVQALGYVQRQDYAVYFGQFLRLLLALKSHRS